MKTSYATWRRAWTVCRAQLAPFAVVGAACTAVDSGLFFLLSVGQGLSPGVASFGSSVSAMAVAYPAHARFTFHTDLSVSGVFRFVAVNVLTAATGALIVQVAAMALASAGSSRLWAALIGKAMAITITAGFNFVAYRRLVYRKRGMPIGTCASGVVRRAVSMAVVIPAYNEARRLGQGLADLFAWITDQGQPVEVLVVDDGSTDATASVARTWPNVRVVSIRHVGKAAAVKAGILASSADVVAVYDADGALDAHYLNAMVAAWQGGTDAICGVRPKDDHRSPTWRRIASRIWRYFVRSMAGRGWPDPQCGLKLLDGRLARELAPEMRVSGFAGDAEWLFRLTRRGARLLGVPVTVNVRPGSRVRLSSALPSMFCDFLRIAVWKLGPGFLWTLGLTLVWLAALWVRLPDYFTVPRLTDEWREVAVALHVLHGSWVLHNASADGGPIWNYLLALEFTIFGRFLWLPRLTVTLASTLTAVLVSVLANRLYGRLAGLLAGLLIGTCAVDALLTHVAWSNELTPLAITLAALSLIGARAAGPSARVRWAVAGAAFGAALQTHASVLAVWPGLEVWLIRLWRRQSIDGRSLVVGHAAAIAATANLWLYNIATGGGSYAWARLHQRYAFAPSLDPAVYGTRLAHLAGQWLRALVTAGSPSDPSLLAAWPLTVVAGACLVIVLARAVRDCPWDDEALIASLCLSSLLLVPILSRYGKWYVDVRYVADVLPLAAILITGSLVRTARHAAQRLRKWPGWGAWAATVVVAAVSVHGVFALRDHEARAQSDRATAALAVARWAAREQARRPRQVFLDAHAPQAGILQWLLTVSGVPPRTLGNPWTDHSMGSFAAKAWSVARGPALAVIAYDDWAKALKEAPLRRVRIIGCGSDRYVLATVIGDDHSWHGSRSIGWLSRLRE